MRPPFPGMDPWLEHPSVWPGLHNRLIAAIADAIETRLPDRYFVGLEERTVVVVWPEHWDLVRRPDLAILTADPTRPGGAGPAAGPGEEVSVLEVEVETAGEVRETFLEIREAPASRLVTVVEVLSPSNKLHRQAREKYEAKRGEVIETR